MAVYVTVFVENCQFMHPFKNGSQFCSSCLFTGYVVTAQIIVIPNCVSLRTENMIIPEDVCGRQVLVHGAIVELTLRCRVSICS